MLLVEGNMYKKYKIKVKESIKNRKPYRVLSLFCGAGGFDLGFIRAGFDIVLGIDFNKDAIDTYKLNFKHPALLADIQKVKLFPDCDVIIGGFPCQGFSITGKREVNDKRNFLYLEFIRVIKEKQPYMFVAENVKGILSMDNGKTIQHIIKDFSNVGYYVRYILLDAQKYGVPQRRERVFIFGIRKDIWDKHNFFTFNITKHMFPIQPKVTLRDAISDIPFSRDDIIEKYLGGFFMKRNRSTSWNGVCRTITAEIPCILHPDSKKMIKVGKDTYRFEKNDDSFLKTRNLTYKECAAIQTFPRDFVFCGGLLSKYRQIGNAVPVNLAYYIGKAVKNILDNVL